MKNFYILLVAIMVTTFSFAQGPIITMISDGDCSGGTPKVLEIYANGTVDFTMYSLENQTNSNTTWGNTLDLSTLGTVTDSFVYVFKDATGGIFTTEFVSATATLEDTGSTMNFNGDDRIRIIETASGTVIDQFGAEGVDGTGSAWEYKDGFSKRNNATNANAGVFSAANWTTTNSGLDGQGGCQGGTLFETIIGLGTYTPPTGNEPAALVIGTPSEGQVVPTGDVTVNFAVTNFDVGAADGTHEGHIHYTVDGAMTMKYDTDPIALTGLAAGAHTIYMELVGDDHVAIDPAVNTTVNFEVQGYTAMGTIADLRSGIPGDFYELTGEVFINYVQSYRHQKWIQDATAGILIDDNSGNITAGMRNDGLTGLKGTLGGYKGMLQFIPIADATVVSPSTLTITPQEVTLADLTASYEDYEAELVKVVNVMLDNAASATFENAIIYPMSQGADAFNLRTSLYDGDLMGTDVPTVAVDVVGLPMEKTGEGDSDYGMVMTPRDLADITIHTASVLENTIKGFNLYPNPVNGSVLHITTAQNLAKSIQIFDILGKQVLSANITGTTLTISKLNAGIYLIKVEEAGNTMTSKLVIR